MLSGAKASHSERFRSFDFAQDDKMIGVLYFDTPSYG